METKELTFKVTGMHCPACETLIGDVLAEDPTVSSVRASLRDQRVYATLHQPLAEAELKVQWNTLLEPMGYKLLLSNEPMLNKEGRTDSFWGILGGVLFLALFVGLQLSGIVNLFSPEKLDLPSSFLLGVMASVSSCFALTGGLLMTLTASVGKRNPGALPATMVAFHATRLLAFFVLGGMLGLLGQALALDQSVFTVLYGAASLIMIGLGLNLLGFWQLFKRAKKQGSSSPAAGSVRTDLAKKLASLGTVGGGTLLGLGTFFLPCGFTQAVQVQALAAGSFLDGGLLTLVFAAGTLPVLLLVSFALTVGLSGRLRSRLLKASGVVVLGLGLYQIQSVLVLMGWIQPLVVL